MSENNEKKSKVGCDVDVDDPEDVPVLADKLSNSCASINFHIKNSKRQVKQEIGQNLSFNNPILFPSQVINQPSSALSPSNLMTPSQILNLLNRENLIPQTIPSIIPQNLTPDQIISDICSKYFGGDKSIEILLLSKVNQIISNLYALANSHNAKINEQEIFKLQTQLNFIAAALVSLATQVDPNTLRITFSSPPSLDLYSMMSVYGSTISAEAVINYYVYFLKSKR